MSEQNKELGPDDLMAQQFEEVGEEKSQDLDQRLENGEDFANVRNVEPLEEQNHKQYPCSEILKEDSKIAMLLDIPLEVTVEIGSTEMAIEDVLKLNPNSVIELDRFVNEPIDLKVNGRVIAKGELYTVKNNFGIKITHIITPEDRLKILDI